jgi:hypothetical protein
VFLDEETMGQTLGGMLGTADGTSSIESAFNMLGDDTDLGELLSGF